MENNLGLHFFNDIDLLKSTSDKQNKIKQNYN